jgi:hypothetical protein
MSYVDVFGANTLPPSELGYHALTITTDTTVVWPYNADSTSTTLAKINNVSCDAGNALTLPDATQVSTGEDFLIRNVGANALTVKSAGGVTVATVASGAASYFYLTDNTTSAGVFGVIGFGVGTSTADAASLVGYGVKAIGNTLNQSHPVVPTASGITIGSTYRSKLVVFTGGSATFNLTAASTLGDDFFALIRNDGTGTLTIDPSTTETIDGLSTLQVQPSESLILLCTGTLWYSVGYGRSVLYQFTQLTKDVSAGGTITLTAAEASNKLITFIGNPAGAVTVIAPSVVAVYYTYSNISTAQTITLKTLAGSGVGISQGARIIAICDGTNVLSAQSAVANSSLSLTDGTVSAPSLYFATQTNSGLYKVGTNGVGVTVNGSNAGSFTTSGTTLTSLQNTPIGSTTPSTGAFTSISLTTDLAVADGGTGVSTLTGIVKGNGTSAFSAATAGTDYLAPPSGTSILKANSGGALANAVAGTDYQAPIGTISGIAKGNGANALTAAVAGTDYLAPAAIGSTVQAYDAQLFSNIPQNSQSTAYTLVATDAQKHILHPSADTTARTFTIPANASVAYPIGTALTFINQNGAGVVTISINSDTLRLAGAGTTGSRTLAANGLATAIKVTSTEWIISGTGLT